MSLPNTDLRNLSLNAQRNEKLQHGLYDLAQSRYKIMKWIQMAWDKHTLWILC